MEKTLIIYDLNGTIIQQITGFYKVPNGVPYIEVEIPKGKYSVSVNVETQEPIYEDIPPTEMELLQDKISNLEAQNIEKDERIQSLESLVFEII